MNPPVPASAPRLVAGYAYCPQPLKDAARRAAGRSVADEFHDLLKDGALATVKQRIAAQPELMAQLLPIVANPEASINVRIGAGVVFEIHAGSAALQALVPRLDDTSAEVREIAADSLEALRTAGR